MANKQYVILIERKDGKGFEYSRSNNPTQRIKKLKEGIQIANGIKPGKHFERFDTFEGCDPEKDVIFRVFKEVI